MNKVAKYKLEFKRDRGKYIDFNILGLKKVYYRPDWNPGRLESYAGGAGLLKNSDYDGYCSLCMTYTSKDDEKVGYVNLPKPVFVVEYSPLYNENGELILIEHDHDEMFVSVDRGGYKDYETNKIVDAELTLYRYGTFTEFNK
jgi:hypothetical protein